MNDDLRITLLGTGTPVPLVERMGCSVLVEGGHDRVIIDCGRGAALGRCAGGPLCRGPGQVGAQGGAWCR